MKTVLAACVALWAAQPLAAQTSLEEGWKQPPMEARLRAYWWWLNGNVDRAAITRDLEEMAAKGFGGAIITDAGGAEQRGNGPVPAGPVFASPAWRELFLHTLREADRLGLEMSLNIQSGWNLGGPTVSAEDSVKRVVWSEALAEGPGPARVALPRPEGDAAYHRDLFVLAFPLEVPDGEDPARLTEWRAKALHDALRFAGPSSWFLTHSSPDTRALITDRPDQPGDPVVRLDQVVDLTAALQPDGTLDWPVPAGRWRVLRFAATLAEHCRVSTHSDGWSGYAIDALDKGAFDRYWRAVVEPLLDAAGRFAGRSLRYLHTDSWEIDHFNWTPTFTSEFRARRGYDPVPYLPALTGRIVESRDVSTRFLNDYRKTLGDLAIDNHYRWFKRYASEHGLGIHPESGGPHFTPVDAQRALGLNDVPMSEFWAASTEHRVLDIARFFVKQPASAAHTYGRPHVAAEGFTTIGPHWQETLWDNLKPSFDLACTEGLNRLVWHAFVSSPPSMGVPGQQYFAGTHLNPLVTWWKRSRPFFEYINRSQWMLMQGRFVADVLYYYGDHVPNYAQLRESDPAALGAGYDYDVITEEALLTRVTVEDGWLVLPDGLRYRMLALPPHESVSLPVLRRIAELVRSGATLVGPRPRRCGSLTGYPACDTEVAGIAEGLWSGRTGRGRVLAGVTARQALAGDGVAPDFEAVRASAAADVHYIHRRTSDADIYFVANRSVKPETIECAFRVDGRAPELWDPVTGERRWATAYRQRDGRTTVPIAFDPYGSVLVVFRGTVADHPATGAPNSRSYAPRQVLPGPWTVSFDPAWGGPAQAEFQDLVSWTDRPEEGIRFYSGTATYRTTLTVPDALVGLSLALDLGEVRELAEVRVNGRRLGVVWSPPFRVEIGASLRAGANTVEIDVVNFWPNRIIGDALLPESRRRTRTNVRTLTRDTPLMRSGLMGPVQLVEVLDATPSQPFVPSGRIDPARVNVLSAADAFRSAGLSLAFPVSHIKPEVVGWTRGDQSLRWTVDVPAADVYAVNVLMGQTSGPALDLRVSAGGVSVTSPFRKDPRGSYSRSPLDQPLRLAGGPIDVTLFVVPRSPGPFAVEVLAVELVRPSVRDALHEEAMALRADARWMPKARYGVMFHWTKRTMPRSGPPRSYADAVEAFDVERFAAQVTSTGAGFVVLTTAHSDQYLPAPIQALDRVLPGRTARRDLIRDLIGALDRRGIRLVLYYHLGPIEDPEWARATGLFETDSRRLFDNWQAIVGEMGERYGEKLSGWWFDDGIYNTYYRSPDWAALDRAAKRGHPGRVVGFNSWKNTSATEFQDFHCGEELVPDGANAFLNRDGSFGGTLVAGGDGRITAGAFSGLQAAATFMMESDWAHLRADTEAAPPRRSPAQLAALIQKLQAYGATPIINMLIYQDGEIAARSLASLREARALLDRD